MFDSTTSATIILDSKLHFESHCDQFKLVQVITSKSQLINVFNGIFIIKLQNTIIIRRAGAIKTIITPIFLHLQSSLIPNAVFAENVILLDKSRYRLLGKLDSLMLRFSAFEPFLPDVRTKIQLHFKSHCTCKIQLLTTTIHYYSIIKIAWFISGFFCCKRFNSTLNQKSKSSKNEEREPKRKIKVQSQKAI